MEPLITVVTAARNAAGFLSEAITSIVNQTATDWEYIVVDDASEDDTPALVEQWSRTDSRIRLIRRSEQGGPYTSANEALEAARGKYIAQIDADDVAPEGRFETQLEFLRANSDLRACAGLHQELLSTGEHGRVMRWADRSPGVLRWWMTLAGGPVHSTLLGEKLAFEAVGRYRRMQVSADRWMLCEFSRRGWLGVVPESLVLRRVHEGQVTRTKRTIQMQEAVSGACDHLRELTDANWSFDEARLLYLVAHREPVADLDSALRVLTRWRSFWRRDRLLLDEERRELEEITKRYRRRLKEGAEGRYRAYKALLYLRRSAKRLVGPRP